MIIENKPNPITENEKNAVFFVHFLSIFVGFLSPLLFWLLKKDESTFIRRHSRNALNFQISMFIYMTIATVLVVFLVGLLILPILSLLNFVFCLVGAIKGYKGEAYKYPMAIAFIK